MVNPIKNTKLELGLLIFLLLVTALIVTKGDLTGFAVAGAVDTSNLQMQWSNGTAAVLLYDNNSQSYGDSSLVNDNMYLKICSTVGGAADLIGSYAKLVYRMQNNTLDLTVLPAQITSAAISGSCATVDVDISTFSAYYPGVVTVALDSSSAFSNSTYYQLTETTGFLNGNYTVRYSQVGANISINASEVYDDQGNLITPDLPFMIVGIKNSSNQITHSAIVQPGTLLEFTYPTDTNFSFVINNFPVPLAYNLDAPEICDNNIDDNGNSLIDCADPDCAADSACLPPTQAAGGGGGGESYCAQKWVCGPWLECQPDNTQARECLDLNDCLNKSIIKKTRLVTNPKPAVTQSCNYIPQCNDHLTNQDETDLDCGGGICIGCELGQHCLLDRDCLSQNCFKEYCRPSGVQCYEDADCPFGFTCEQFECLFLKVFRKPAKLSPLEKYILWILLAIVLLLSSYITYERYTRSAFRQKLVGEKYGQALTDFIQKASLQGYTKEQIKDALLKKGWPDKIVKPYVNKLCQKKPKPKVSAQKFTLQEEIKSLEEDLKKLR